MTANKDRAVNGYDYNPFSNSLFEHTQQANPFQYDSSYLDQDTGLYKFGTRYYDPTVERWTQQDPVGASLASPDSLNRYLYVGDNPVNAVDPSGNSPLCAVAFLALPFVLYGEVSLAIPLIQGFVCLIASFGSLVLHWHQGRTPFVGVLPSLDRCVDRSIENTHHLCLSSVIQCTYKSTTKFTFLLVY